MSDAIVVALVSGFVALVSAIISYMGSQKAAKSNNDLWQYRIDRLEEKVTKHNNVIERMTKAEIHLDGLTKIVEKLEEEIRNAEST